MGEGNGVVELLVGWRTFRELLDFGDLFSSLQRNGGRYFF
jgi:hypothetical protein